MKGIWELTVLSLHCFFKIIPRFSLLKILIKILKWEAEREQVEVRLFTVYLFITFSFLNYVNISHIKNNPIK